MMTIPRALRSWRSTCCLHRCLYSVLSLLMLTVSLSAQGDQKATSRVDSFRPSGRGGSLLPSGYLSTRGSQIVDADGTPVRISSIGWDGTDGKAGAALEGLWAANYRTILQSIKDDGFNAVRIPWSNVNLDAPVAGVGTKDVNGVDWTKNAELRGLTTLQMFMKVVEYARQIGMKVIFDHHTDDGNGGQQPNGLWIDKGPGTDGTDGVTGMVGTVDAARFEGDWMRFARAFAGNPTVIGFDLDNEPHGALWGGGGPTDIRKMFIDVGNAIHAVNPGVLIICEPSEDYTSPTDEGNVSVANISSKPVLLKIPNKVVYSVHEYPNEVTQLKLDSGPEFVKHMNYAWGDVVKHQVAPVWIGEMGSDMKSASSKAWAKTLLDYMNGKDGALGGPVFTGDQQPVSGSWWKAGVEGHNGNPDGNQTAWGLGNYRPNQQAVTDQMLFRPRATPGRELSRKRRR
jgi:endoglucanase